MILNRDEVGYWIKPCCTKSIGYFSWYKNLSSDYYEEKKFRLAHCKNIHEAFGYSVDKNKERFAKEIGVSVDDFNATYRVLRNI